MACPVWGAEKEGDLGAEISWGSKTLPKGWLETKAGFRHRSI